MRSAAILSLLLSPGFPAWAASSDGPAGEPPPSFAEALLPAASPSVEVIWPKDGSKFPFVERSFTFGNVAPGSSLTINGLPVEVSTDGVFFEMVGFSTGSFSLDFAAVLAGQTASTRVVVEVAPEGGIEPEEGEMLALEPASDRIVLPGDLIVVRCKGPPGYDGVFRIWGLSSRLPMAEREGVPGLYEGHYVVQPRDRGEDLKVSCGVKLGFLRSAKAEAPGRITVWDPSQRRVALTTARTTVLKTSLGGYSLFFASGTLLEIDGKLGSLWRVRLSEHERGYVDEWRVKLLAEGAPPPRGQIGRYLNTVAGPDSVRLYADATTRLPFEVRQSIEPLAFEVRFFGAEQRFDRVRYSADDPVISEVRWRQESSRVVRMSVATRLEWGWGYDAFYDDKGRFVLEIRRPPYVARVENVLAGRKVIVDPGHGPQKSAVGPRGTTERDVNLEISRRLHDQLLAEGADVYMIRTSTDGPLLSDRPAVAWEQRGDLYVSVHNNAFPVTADPFEKARGYMTFYYHPQSRPLAKAVHSSYRRRHADLADEFVRWGDLHVCRVTQMPSILTESAYMILPEQEKLLNDPAGQEAFARTIVEGIRGYLERYRRIQRRYLTERRAARGYERTERP